MYPLCLPKIQEINREEISDNIVASLNVQQERNSLRIQSKRYTRMTSWFWSNFCALPGSAQYRCFVDGRWRYFVVCWQKPIATKKRNQD